MQAGAPFRMLPQRTLHSPQCWMEVEVFASQPFSAFPSQSANPGLQANPQAPEEHIAVALAGVGQGVQRVPQLLTAVSGTHSVPQA